MTLLPDQLTPLSHEDLIAALRQAYPVVFGRECLAAELAVYFAQCVLENGAKLDALHCYGLGNVKATPSWTGDTVTYECQEVFSGADAAHAKALGPCTFTPLEDGTGRVSVVLPAGHPWAIFRAFETARDAAEHYLKLFTMPRYAQAALRARAGDAAGFVLMAHDAGYFTADPAPYERAVASIAAKAVPACAAALEGKTGGIDDAFRAHVQEQVLLTLAEAHDTDPPDAPVTDRTPPTDDDPQGHPV